MKKIRILSTMLLVLYVIAPIQGNGEVTAAVINYSGNFKGGEKTVTLKITGMTCAGCASHISASLTNLDGVLKQEVKFPGDIAVITYDPEKTNEKEIIATVEKSGNYRAEVIVENSSDEKSPGR